MGQKTGIYYLLHADFADAGDNLPGRNIRRKTDRICAFTIPGFTSTIVENKGTNRTIFLKRHDFRYEIERIFYKTDGIFLERLHSQKKTDEFEHERVQKFSKTVIFAAEALEKVYKTHRKFPATLHGFSETQQKLSGVPGILIERLENFSQGYRFFLTRHIPGPEMDEILSRCSLCRDRGYRKITGSTLKIFRGTLKPTRGSRNFSMTS